MKNETDSEIVNTYASGQKMGLEVGKRIGRAYLTDITHRNYEATKHRGLIDDKTTQSDFIKKLNEAVWKFRESDCDDWYELANVALVCFDMAEHYGIDLIEEMRKKTEFNEKRT